VLALSLLENGVKVRIIEKLPAGRIGSKGNGQMVSPVQSKSSEIVFVLKQ
jgi:hypothetical protein